MADALRLDQDAIVGKLIRVWSWADQNSVNGSAVKVSAAFLDRLTAKKGFAAAMRSVGWLSGEDGNLSLSNFERHNGETAKARAETNRRVANHRQRNAATVTDVTQTPLQTALQKPLPEKRREEIEKSITNIAPGSGALAAGNQPPPPPPPPPVEPPAKPKRERNPLMDAMAGCGGADPLQVVPSAWSGIGKALADIVAVCPDVTPAEIARRSVNYRTHMRDTILTPHALAKNWALCDRPNEHQHAGSRPATAPLPMELNQF